MIPIVRIFTLPDLSIFLVLGAVWVLLLYWLWHSTARLRRIRQFRRELDSWEAETHTDAENFAFVASMRNKINKL